MLNFRLMRPLKAIMLACLLSMLATEIMAETERGQALYENHCQFCHEYSVHTRKTRLVSSPESLHAWVTSWSVHAGLNWGNQEVDEVTQYLNSRFYQFTD